MCLCQVHYGHQKCFVGPSSMVVLVGVVVVVALWDILASVWFLLFALNRLSEAPDLLEHVRN